MKLPKFTKEQLALPTDGCGEFVCLGCTKCAVSHLCKDFKDDSGCQGFKYRIVRGRR